MRQNGPLLTTEQRLSLNSLRQYAPAAHLRTVLAFLSLNKPPRSMWRRMMAQPRANRHAPGREPALIDTHRQLRTFYAEYNEQVRMEVRKGKEVRKSPVDLTSLLTMSSWPI